VEGIGNEIALFEIKPSFIGCIIVGLKKLPANGYQFLNLFSTYTDHAKF